MSGPENLVEGRGSGEMYGFLLFMSLFFAAGLGLLGYGAVSAYHAIQAQSWPTTVAKITQLQREEGCGDDASPTVRVQYQYEVDGVTYESDRVAFGLAVSGDGRYGADEAIYLRLQNATTVVTRYKPSDPRTACLSPGLNRPIIFTLVFAINWLCFTTGFVLIGVIPTWWKDALASNIIVK